MDAPITGALPQAFIVSELQLARPSLAALPRHVRWSLDSLRHTNGQRPLMPLSAQGPATVPPVARSQPTSDAFGRISHRSRGQRFSGTRDGDHRQRDSADVAMRARLAFRMVLAWRVPRQPEMNEPRRVHARAHRTIDGSSLG